ncbi:hypothetical protein BD779DRAFT_127784 [Infundibulicybe gibba]|nr:hypothetical protein BD779DRAFT_127784 [Infundibulicybe gibba]
MSINAQLAPSSSTPRPSPRDTDSAPQTMLLQNSRIRALLQDSTCRGVIDQLRPVLLEYLPSGEVENAGPPRPNSQDLGSTFPAMLLQDSRLQAMLQDSTFRSVMGEFRSAVSGRTRTRMPPIRRSKKCSPPVGYVVDQRALSCITVPPKPDGATLAENPDGWSECLVTNKIKAKILSTPGFPTPLVRPPRAHRIDSSPGKGLGIFATRDLDMGDLIHVERPLLVIPSCTTHVKVKCPQGWSEEQVEWAKLFEWDKQCYRALERLEPEAQGAYLSLANVHTEDGTGTTHGILRTNGFGIDGLADTVGTSEAPYIGVCKEFSRANHSCRPNVTRYFDQKAFAYHFSAARPIKTGEEMTVAYSVLSGVRSVRQQGYQRYGFDCDCSACDPDSEASDQNRRDIAASVDGLDSNYAAWLRDKTLPKDELIKTSRWWMKVIESEGLECLPVYRRHLGAIYRAYVALGDKENAVKYGALMGKWCRAAGKQELPIAWLSDPRRLQKRPDWAIRRV